MKYLHEEGFSFGLMISWEMWLTRERIKEYIALTSWSLFAHERTKTDVNQTTADKEITFRCLLLSKKWSGKNQPDSLNWYKTSEWKW